MGFIRARLRLTVGRAARALLITALVALMAVDGLIFTGFAVTGWPKDSLSNDYDVAGDYRPWSIAERAGHRPCSR
jgi:hypothetical protein